MIVRRPLLIVAILAVLAVGGYMGYKYRTNRQPEISGPSLTVRFFDMEAGGGILVRTPEQHFILIDPGPRRTADELISRLRDEDAKSVTVLLSNASAAHIGALESLLNRVRVSRVYSGERSDRSSTWRSILATLKKRGISAATLRAGRSLSISETTTLEVLSPPSGLIRGAGEDDDSLVTRISFGGKRFLFTSSIRTAAEAYLIASGVDLQSDVLAVPRHGRYPGVSLELLRQVRPEICEITVGTGADHPSTTLLNRLATKNTGADVYRTDKYGTIDMVTDGHSILVQTEKAASD